MYEFKMPKVMVVEPFDIQKLVGNGFRITYPRGTQFIPLVDWVEMDPANPSFMVVGPGSPGLIDPDNYRIYDFIVDGEGKARLLS